MNDLIETVQRNQEASIIIGIVLFAIVYTIMNNIRRIFTDKYYVPENDDDEENY